jgi:hypothetical protein
VMVENPATADLPNLKRITIPGKNIPAQMRDPRETTHGEDLILNILKEKNGRMTNRRTQAGLQVHQDRQVSEHVMFLNHGRRAVRRTDCPHPPGRNQAPVEKIVRQTLQDQKHEAVREIETGTAG